MAHTTITSLPPNAQDAELARLSVQKLAKTLTQTEPLAIRLGHDAGETVTLPADAVRLLMDILKAMAQGNGLMLIPERAELTTVQAAGLLNVSRPYLIKLLEEGEIPFSMVGTHRRIRLEALLAYKEALKQQQTKALDEMAQIAQEEDWD